MNWNSNKVRPNPGEKVFCIDNDGRYYYGEFLDSWDARYLDFVKKGDDAIQYGSDCGCSFSDVKAWVSGEEIASDFKDNPEKLIESHSEAICATPEEVLLMFKETREKFGKRWKAEPLGTDS